GVSYPKELGEMEAELIGTELFEKNISKYEKCKNTPVKKLTITGVKLLRQIERTNVSGLSRRAWRSNIATLRAATGATFFGGALPAMGLPLEVSIPGTPFSDPISYLLPSKVSTFRSLAESEVR